MIRHSVQKFSCILFLLLATACQAQLVDFSQSERLAQPYSAKWTKWAQDGRAESEKVRDIVQDFRGLAASDFIAACRAYFGADIPYKLFGPIQSEMGGDLRRGLAYYHKYVTGLYLYRNEGKPVPAYPEGLPRPGQPWPGLEGEKRPLLSAAGTGAKPLANSEPSKPKARKLKFVTREAIYSLTGPTDRQPLAYIGGYQTSSDRYLLLGTYRPMDNGPHSGRPNDRYVSAEYVESNYVGSRPKTYMCPGCEGRTKLDVGRNISMSRESNKDRIVVHKNEALQRVECGYCYGKGWGTLYSIER